MKGSYQVVLTVVDVEDALEVAEALAPLRSVKNIKVGSIGPRPEPRPAPALTPITAQEKMAQRKP
jgi:hypothetical protein